MVVTSNFLNQYKQIIIFLFVGGSSSLVDIGSLYLFNKVLLCNNELSISSSFTLGLIFNYFANTYFTFKEKANVGNLVKYLILVLLNYINTIVLMYLLIELVHIDIIIAKVITLPFIAVTTFVISKVWVYK
ncbi:GtrA family protein [Aggregatibacter actinomycetemcomitans]|uniref:GtrA family protein n=1 Tax=Aggregatibacter actinomycetemcomitans TaxID=714 RepID=UPI00197C7015|nr:GtrA family protein [Aggregatibacter actinomycetemcomitans]MBN6064010.1 GtrA family protein [Aggregatibacter actinomycetemcomitans]MBN6082270.1 GtrA family protein [Aggregatibacter actinomycetemcomitans]MBN6083911.1 GtrA family protein [Aggregatibacter actinomycetemcomitans]